MAKKRATSKNTRSRAANDTDDTEGVECLLAGMTHPMIEVIEDIRGTILAADEGITEGVKWNSPSFYCCGWFATIGARKPDRIEIVLHHGAKVRQDAALSDSIKDPAKLLRWKSPDRAVISIADGDDFGAIREPLAKLIDQWVAYQRRLFSNGDT